MFPSTVRISDIVSHISCLMNNYSAPKSSSGYRNLGSLNANFVFEVSFINKVDRLFANAFHEKVIIRCQNNMLDAHDMTHVAVRVYLRTVLPQPLVVLAWPWHVGYRRLRAARNIHA